MSDDSLCLSIYFENNILGPYSFYFDKKINNYFSWFNVSNDLKIIWNSENNYWEILNIDKIINGELRNFSDIWLPVGSWVVVGLIPNSYAEVSLGECLDAPMILKGKVQNNTCSNKCNGSIIMSALGDYRPYLYSIDNGVTFQGSPIFKKLCQGSYNILGIGGTNSVVSKTFDVGFQNNNITYNLSLNIESTLSLSESTRQLSWHLDITPPLINNEIINLTFGVNLETTIDAPGSAQTLNSVNVYTKDTPLFSGLTQLTPINLTTSYNEKNRDFCFPNKTITSFSGFTYSSTIDKDSILSGISTSIIYDYNKEISENGCQTKIMQKNSIKIISASVINCECCDVIVDSTKTIEINKHER